MSDISIIIPTLNRQALLTQTLESLAAIVSPTDPVEIVVVDNGSTDNTAAAVASLKEKFHSLEWRDVYEPSPGLLAARHRGAREAKGEILSYLDDDVLLAPTWLEALKDAFRDPTIGLAGGPASPLYDVQPPDWFKVFWQEVEEGRTCMSLSVIDFGNTSKLINPRYVWGLNFSIRKDVLHQCGGFSPDLYPKLLQRYQGDGETGLAFRIKDAGIAALYHPGLAVTHVIPAHRFKVEAIEQRWFYHGICASYVRIRRDRLVPSPSRKSLMDCLRPAKWYVKRRSILRNPTAENIGYLVGLALKLGAQFHESEVRKDPKLFEWVTKPDYFDYRLPEGR